MTPDWTILIATLGSRSLRFQRLMGSLMPQIDTPGAEGRVRVLALWNNGERPLGEVRQDLIEGATGTYTSFIDDDDEVPEYYIRRVLPLLDGVDYIGWAMQCWMDGHKLKPTYHSLRYSAWTEDGAGYYRDISHLNPVRRELALTADFRRAGKPEDVSWSSQLRGTLRTEHYIPDVMYYYRSNTADSTWMGVPPVAPGTYERSALRAPWFSWHPASSA